MTPSPKPPAAAKVLLVFMIIVGVIRLFDYVVHGRQFHDLFAGIGFLLMAHGIHRNGLELTTGDTVGRYASMAGIAMVMLGFVVRYLG